MDFNALTMAEKDKEGSTEVGVLFITSLVYRIIVYRIDDTIRIVDTFIRYTIRIAIRIVSFMQ